MSNRPPFSWNAVLRDLHADRAPVAPVRELSCIPGVFAWRGVSGTRYAVTPKTRDVVPADGVVGLAPLAFTESGVPAIPRLPPFNR